MALRGFFRINLPYGIAKSKDSNKWVAFNREYKPLGVADDSYSFYVNLSEDDSPHLYKEYEKLNEKSIIKIFGEDGIQREDGKIVRAFFYGDATNPANQPTHNNSYWTPYFKKLKALSEFY